MSRKTVLLSLLLLAQPLSLWADEAQPDSAAALLSCGAQGEMDESMFEPIEPRELTAEEKRDLRDLFKRVSGQWHGRLLEEICMAGGASRHREYDSELKARKIADELEMAFADVRLDNRTTKRHKRRFFISSEGLQVDVPSKRGDVELLKVADDTLSFMRRYRVVRTQEAANQQKRTFSVAHEERYTLQLTGTGTLTVTQHFLTQGFYSGSMTWRLGRN